MLFKKTKKANADSFADIEFKNLRDEWNHALEILQVRAENVIVKQGTLDFYINQDDKEKAMERAYDAKQELAKAIDEYNAIRTRMNNYIIEYKPDFVTTNPAPREKHFTAQDIIERVYEAFYKR